MTSPKFHIIEDRTIEFAFDHLPPKPLRPNARMHWRRKAAITKSAREYAWAIGRELLLFYAVATEGYEGRLRAKMPDLPFERARITFMFGYPTATRRDLDNFVAAMKPYIDGLVDAGVVVDDSSDHLEHGAHSYIIDRDSAPDGIVHVYLKPLD